VVQENSRFIVNRYSENTLTFDYPGHSFASTVTDIAPCSTGSVAAHWFRPLHSVMLFPAIEVVMTLAIRDCLLLNLLMLVCPIDRIMEWQSVLS